MPRTQHVKNTRLTGGGDNAASEEMATAAAQLAANQRQLDEMHERLAVANLAVLVQAGDGNALTDARFDAASDLAGEAGDLGAMIASLQRLVGQAELAHEATIQEYTDRYPLLAGYKKRREERVEIDAGALDRLQGGGRGQEIYSQIQPALDNIELTENALDRGEIDPWKEPRMLSVAMAQQAIAPGSLRAKMVEAVQGQHAGGGWENWAVMAVTFGLAVLTAIPTGGSSLVGAVVVAAEIGGAVLDIYMLSDEIREFNLDQAKAGTDLDKARAISMNEPDFFWLALDIVATGIGLKMASSTFTEVAHDLARARDAARLGQMAEAEADIAVANVHRAAREGRLSADAAEHAEQEIRAGATVAEDAGAAGHDARLRVTGERRPELEQRLGVPVEIDQTGKLNDGVEVHYRKTGNGDIDVAFVRVGAKALVDDVLAHGEVIRRITRYNGVLGKLRALWDRLVVMAKGSANPFKKASREWEAFEELQKIDNLVEMRWTARMSRDLVDPAILDDEIGFLESMRARHEVVVSAAESSGEFGPGIGHIDSPDSWRFGVANDYQDATPHLPDHGHLPTAGEREIGASGFPKSPAGRSAEDILAEGPHHTASELDQVDEAWRERPDADRLAEHGQALDEHELEYRVKLREGMEAGEDPAKLGSHKGKITEADGERAATKYMMKEEPGTELERGFAAGEGYDQIWVRRVDGEVREYIIVEAKGPGAQLLKGGSKGDQMTNEWVRKNAEELAKAGKTPEERQLGRDMLEALESGDPPVTGRVIESDGAGGYVERGLPEKDRATFGDSGEKGR